MSIASIAILGAGHGGCAAAADLTRRGFEVRLHARRAAPLDAIRANGGITARGVQEGVVPIDRMTTSVAEAVDGADLIMLVVPSVAHEHYARELAPLLSPETPVFLNPGHTGGGLHFVHELRKAGYDGDVQTCETVTLTYIARLEDTATVGIYSYTKKLRFAAFPGRNAERLYDLMLPLFPEIVAASSVLETALLNINAIFHPPGMLMNAGWIEHTGGDFLYYKDGITDAIGRVVSAIDHERMAIADALGIPTVTFLDAFHQAGLTTEEARDSGDVARACKESAPNATIKSPPSLDHRYVHEDVAYGLVPMAALGRLAGVPTPTIDSHIHLLSEATGNRYAETGLTLEKMGLADVSKDQIMAFLQNGAS